MSTTIRDIAEHVGISKSTVARALKGHGAVAPATREKVLEAARALDYRPDAVLSAIGARSWSRRQAHSGNVLAFLWNSDISNSEWAMRPWRGFEEGSRALGYTVEAVDVSRYPSVKSLEKMLHSRGIRGLLLFALNLTPEDLPGFHWRRFLTANLNEEDASGPQVALRFNHFQNLLRLSSRLEALETRRIGFVLFRPAVLPSSHLRRKAGVMLIRQRLKALCRQTPVLTLCPQKQTFAQLTGLVSKWWQKFQPDVVVGLNHFVSVLLEESGIRCGNDFDFISLLVPLDAPSSLTGFQVDDVTAGQEAVRHLDILLRHTTSSVRNHEYTVVIDAPWQSGSTWSPPAKE